MPHVVRVVSRRVPAIEWSCSSCHDRVPFDCSERFRANSNGKLVDIWLIYRCRRCDTTKNLTIVERRAVARVPSPLLLAAEHNDAAFARQCARDLGLLRRNGATVAEGDDWAMVDEPADGPPVVIELEEPMVLRLDAVVAAALGRSRSWLRTAVAGGELRVDVPGRLDALRRWEGRVSVTGSGPSPAGRASSAVPRPGRG